VCVYRESLRSIVSTASSVIAWACTQGSNELYVVVEIRARPFQVDSSTLCELFGARA